MRNFIFFMATYLTLLRRFRLRVVGSFVGFSGSSCKIVFQISYYGVNLNSGKLIVRNLYRNFDDRLHIFIFIGVENFSSFSDMSDHGFIFLKLYRMSFIENKKISNIILPYIIVVVRYGFCCYLAIQNFPLFVIFVFVPFRI